MTTPTTSADTPPTDTPQRPPRDLDVLVYPGFALMCIGLVVWLALSWGRYKNRVPGTGQDWQVGGTHLVEVTLTREDRGAHACASGVDIDGMQCAFDAEHHRLDPPIEDEHQVLRPYTTARGEIFLGAGLWSAPNLANPPHDKRFSVVCNFHIQGVVKHVALRWELHSHFKPVKTSLAAGALTDCAFPR